MHKNNYEKNHRFSLRKKNGTLLSLAIGSLFLATNANAQEIDELEVLNETPSTAVVDILNDEVSNIESVDVIKQNNLFEQDEDMNITDRFSKSELRHLEAHTQESIPTGFTFRNWSSTELQGFPFKQSYRDTNIEAPVKNATVMVLVKKTDGLYTFGSATLIGAQTYITAAHTFMNDKATPPVPEEIDTIYLIQDIDEDVTEDNVEEIVNGKKVIKIQNPAIDPQSGDGLYFYDRLNYKSVSQNDIAILRVPELPQAKYRMNIKPLELHGEETLKRGTHLTWSAYPSHSHNATNTFDPDNNYNGHRITNNSDVFLERKGLYFMHSDTRGGASGAGVYTDDNKVAAVLTGYIDTRPITDTNQPTVYSAYTKIAGDSYRWVKDKLNALDKINRFWDDANGNRYYIEDKHVLAAGEREINNKIYTFDQNGRLISEKDKPATTTSTPTTPTPPAPAPTPAPTTPTTPTPPTTPKPTPPSVKQTKKIVEIPFDTIENVKANEWADYRVVKQNGIVGTKEVVKENDKIVKETIISNPVNEIVEIGSKPINWSNDVEIPYETIEETDNSKPIGHREVKTTGKNGTKRIHYVKDKVQREEVIQNPTNEILIVGSKPNDVIETMNDIIPFNTIERENDQLLVGTRNIIQKGQLGSKTVTKTNGAVTNETITKAPIDEIVEIGTKPQITKHVTTHKVPFNIIYKTSSELKKDDIKVIQIGELGEKTIEYENNKQVKEVITKEPKTQIVAYGIHVSPKSFEEKQAISYKTTIINDNTLKIGTEVIEKEGQFGLKIKTTTTTLSIPDNQTFNSLEELKAFVNGFEKQTTTTETITVQPINQVIKKGTKPFIETFKIKEQPFETIMLKTNDLYQGQKVTKTKGKVGHIKEFYIDDELTNAVTLNQPQNQIILIGTKESHDVTIIHDVDVLDNNKVIDLTPNYGMKQTPVKLNALNHSKNETSATKTNVTNKSTPIIKNKTTDKQNNPIKTQKNNDLKATKQDETKQLTNEKETLKHEKNEQNTQNNTNPTPNQTQTNHQEQQLPNTSDSSILAIGQLLTATSMLGCTTIIHKRKRQ